MRTLLTVCCALIAVAPAWAQEEPRPRGTEPIKVITIDRKTPVTYDGDIEPILVNKCIFCHSGNRKEGNFDMITFETLMKGGKRGAPVVAGKSAESLLYGVSGKTMKPWMPLKSEEPLSPEELALVKLWIDQGAKAPATTRVRVVNIVGLPAGVVPVRGVAISPDKSTVAASRGNQIHIYDAGTGTYVRSLKDPQLVGPDKKPYDAAHLALIESMAYSPDGKYLATGAFREVFLWDAQTGQIRQRITNFADRVTALAFSPDGKLLATGGGPATEDGELRVYEVPTGKMVFDAKMTEPKNAHSDTVFGVCFSPDGTKLASASADKFVKTWEVPSGKFIKAFEGHTQHVLDVSWRGDGKNLASAGADNVVKVWDFDKGEQLRTINAHTKQVTRLQFVGKTANFVTCSGDQSVKMWNSDNGGNQRNFTGNTDFLYALGVSLDGKVVATGGEEGVVRLYNGDTGALIKALLPPGVPMPKAP
jgi:WD40 repeat protein